MGENMLQLSYQKMGDNACKRWDKAMRNNELRGPTAIDTDIIPSDSEHVFAQEALYQEAMMRYHCAIWRCAPSWRCSQRT